MCWLLCTSVMPATRHLPAKRTIPLARRRTTPSIACSRLATRNFKEKPEWLTRRCPTTNLSSLSNWRGADQPESDDCKADLAERSGRTFWQYFLRRSFSILARSSMGRSMNERGTPPSWAAGKVSDCACRGQGQGYVRCWSAGRAHGRCHTPHVLIRVSPDERLMV